MAAWLDSYRETEQLGHDIMELINERNTLKRSASNTSKVQSSIRIKMQQYSSGLQRLKDLLLRDSSSYNVTQQELQRRQNQLDVLVSKEQQLNQAFKPTQSNYDRSNLFGEKYGDDLNGKYGGASASNGLDDDLTPQNFRQQQEQILKEQDKGLDSLHEVIQRQKMMGKAIGNELEYQNDLIDDITKGVSRVDNKVNATERKVKKVHRKTGSCAMIVVIILLLIAILVVAVFPTN